MRLHESEEIEVPDALGTSQIRAIHQEVVSLDVLGILPRHPSTVSKVQKDGENQRHPTLKCTDGFRWLVAC